MQQAVPVYTVYGLVRMHRTSLGYNVCFIELLQVFTRANVCWRWPLLSKR